MEVLGPQLGDIPFETDARLREIELPLWEGLSFAEIRRRFPDQFLTWRLHPDLMLMPAAWGASQFPVQDLYSRVRLVWRNLLADYAGKSILLVTHGGTGRALITTALGIGPQCFHSVQQCNCGISRLRFAAERDGAQLELLNDTTHLGDRLPKLKEGRTGVRLLLIPAQSSGLEQVSSVLEPVAVDKVLLSGIGATATASAVFQGHAEESMEPVSEEALGRRVRRILASESDNQLRHVAIVASPDCLQRVLGEQLGLAGSSTESLFQTGMGITAVHCPGQCVPPVLQAMNVFEPEFSLAGVQS
jgi:probable phosphoglycerate mutase